MQKQDYRNLRECPFCGGEAFVRKLYRNYIVDAKHDRNCPMANMPIPYDTHWVTQLAAEAAWNRRENDGCTDVA